jgi:hypothetical protein
MGYSICGDQKEKKTHQTGMNQTKCNITSIIIVYFIKYTQINKMEFLTRYKIKIQIRNYFLQNFLIRVENL